MEFTVKDLIAGKTVLIGIYTGRKYLYLGCCGLVHFISKWNKCNSANVTIEQLNKLFTIEKEEDLTVPLEQKVYDFVDVEVSNDNKFWYNRKLIAVVPNNSQPYKVVDENGYLSSFKYAKFIYEKDNK